MKLSNKQLDFLEALLSSSTIAEAARQADISEKTAYNYLADDAFNDEYLHYKRLSLKHIVTRLNDIALQSLEILHEIAHDTEQTGTSRIRAVDIMLNYTFKGMQYEDMDKRINELEKRLEEMET